MLLPLSFAACKALAFALALDIPADGVTVTTVMLSAVVEAISEDRKAFVLVAASSGVPLEVEEVTTWRPDDRLALASVDDDEDAPLMLATVVLLCSNHRK